MAERVTVFDYPVFYSTVVYCTEYAGVEGDGVWCNTTILEPCFVSFHCLRSDVVEHDVLVVAIFTETAECGLIGFRCADFAVLYERSDDALREVEEGVIMGVAVEFFDYIIGSVGEAVGIELSADFREALNVPTDLLADGED